ncbi:hypothetical protein OK349_13450 [Sphingomonas sp. BT-65]|uniref:hypothetical protein n=1 Tax=Sphingomonas sp. BT-65 TaxID=2989821 RepID=UPI0022358D3D|nr:hypothetical protein [Sphingomonas sp. BT-65]MCW4462716.1 hypothetical protein [Sphingomonas sp. BT-65]
MADLYRAYQKLFERVGRRDHSTLRMHTADSGKIDALRALKDGLRGVAAALEAAVFDLQNSGQTNDQLSLALSIANHCAAGAAQMLVAALDGSEEIRAAVDAMEQSAEALGKIRTGTEELIEDLDNVTGVLTAAGQMLELIKA